MTNSIIAYCGLICNNCPAFIATKNGDHKRKKELAKIWADHAENLSIEDITCYGCKSENKKTKFCGICLVRSCCQNKNIDNCAHCKDYPCQKYIQLIKNIESPEAKDLLDKINFTPPNSDFLD